MPSRADGIFISLENMPIDFVITRASSIPKFVIDPRSKVKAGITGSDILWEYGLTPMYGDKIPISNIRPEAKQSWLFVGITKDLFEELNGRNLRKPTSADLEGITVATKFPNIAREYFDKQGVADIDLLPVQGTDEAMQFIFPNCYGILGILSTKKTVAANRLEVLDVFYKTEVRVFKEEGKLTSSEKQIFDDFRGLITRSAEAS